MIFLNRPRTTRSCRHKALLSRHGPDTIEEDLAGPKARLTLSQALRRSHKCFLQCVILALCPSGVVLCDVKSGDVIYGVEQGYDHCQ